MHVCSHSYICCILHAQICSLAVSIVIREFYSWNIYSRVKSCFFFSFFFSFLCKWRPSPRSATVPISMQACVDMYVRRQVCTYVCSLQLIAQLKSPEWVNQKKIYQQLGLIASYKKDVACKISFILLRLALTIQFTTRWTIYAEEQFGPLRVHSRLDSPNKMSLNKS